MGDIIELNGQQFAMIPAEVYEEILERLDIVEGALEQIISGEESEQYPGQVIGRIVDGENPVRVFREYRNITKDQLAQAINATPAYITSVESDVSQASLSSLQAIAQALQINVDELMPLP